MSQPLALAALAGLISSALFLSLISGVPGIVLLAYFVQLPVMLAGLALGLAYSLMAGVVAATVAGMVAGVVAAVTYAAVQAGPAVVVVRQALLSRDVDGQVEWYPPGRLLGQLTLFAAAAIVVAFIVFAGEPDGLAGVIGAFLAAALAEFGAIAADSPLPEEARTLVALFPGLMASSWLLMTALNGVLAQHTARRMQRNIRPSPDYTRLELPTWLWIGVAVTALLSLFGGTLGMVGGSLLMVLAVPYFFLGLAVAHAVARRWQHRRLTLFAFYASVIVLGWPALLVVLLGLVEDWAGLRKKLT
jgi:hypothetical protein